MRYAFVMSFVDPLNRWEIPDIVASARLDDTMDVEHATLKLEHHFNKFFGWLYDDIYVERQSEGFSGLKEFGIHPGVYKKISQFYQKFPCIKWADNRWITIINER